MGSTSLYEDLNDLAFDEKLIKLQDENKKLLDHIKSLENDISKLCKELTHMKSRESSLKRNISELFNTAKLENERKDKTIADLQIQIDDLIFNRRYRATVNPFRESYHNNKRTRNSSSEEIETKKIKLEDKSGDREYRHKNRDYKDSRSLDRNRDRHRRTTSTERNKYQYRSRDRDRHSSRSDRNSSEKGQSRERNVKIERNESQDLRKVNNYIGDNLKIEIKNERVDEHLSNKRKTEYMPPDTKQTHNEKEDSKDIKHNPLIVPIENIKTEPDLINDIKNKHNGNLEKSIKSETCVKEDGSILSSTPIYIKKEHTNKMGRRSSESIKTLSNTSTSLKTKITKESKKEQSNKNDKLTKKIEKSSNLSLNEKIKNEISYMEKSCLNSDEKQNVYTKLCEKDSRLQSNNKDSLYKSSHDLNNKSEFTSSNALKMTNDVPSEIKAAVTETKGQVINEGVNGNTSANRRRRCIIKMVN